MILYLKCVGLLNWGCSIEVFVLFEGVCCY